LFLGFLKGVKFLWTVKQMFPIVLFCTSVLLAVFFFLDTYYYRRDKHLHSGPTDTEKFSITGKINLVLIPCVTLSVLVSTINMGSAFTIHYVTIPVSKLIQIIMLLAITYTSIKLTSY